MILIVEDEKKLYEIIKFNLELQNYITDWAENGLEAKKKIFQNSYDLIILDLGLPIFDGFTVLKQIRAENIITPVLILSAKSFSKDRIMGLKLGGNDYLIKPFEMEELLLRIKNLLLLTQPKSKTNLNLIYFEFNGFKINFSERNIFNTKNNQKFILSPKELAVLHYLVYNEGKIISRKEIMETVWKNSLFDYTRTLDNIILNFRKIFENQSETPQYFITIRGVGYKFKSIL